MTARGRLTSTAQGLGYAVRADDPDMSVFSVGGHEILIDWSKDGTIYRATGFDLRRPAHDWVEWTIAYGDRQKTNKVARWLNDWATAN